MNRHLSLPLLLAIAACSGDPFPAPSRPAAPPGPVATAAPDQASTAASPDALPRPTDLRLPRTAVPARYQLSLTLSPGKAPYEGVVDVDLKITEALSVLWLHASALSVTEAHLETLGKSIRARAVPGGDELLGLVLDERIQPGVARLHVAFTGVITDKDDRGLFVETEEGRPYVYTQFESIFARRAFPCFDEPSYKVPWQLTLRVPEGETALSNTPVISDTREGATRVVRFAETRPLPSYLVAFAVGPFDLVDGGKAGKKSVPVRIAVPRGQGAQAAYAAATTRTVLAQLEDYLGLPFPYEKLDVVAVPRLVTFGAMENPGLITFTRAGMLARPEEETPALKMRFAATMAHELGHHWFGDLVTTAWWDDTWLNEAFASWVEAKALVPWKPEWHYEVQRGRATARAMAGDGLTAARRVRQGILANDDIENAFDEITYSKGAAVIGMFEAYLGPDRFRAGVQRYLGAHAHGSATAADFLAALGQGSGRDVGEAFSTFLDQPGIPLVRAELSCEGGAARVSLSQQRYLPIGSEGAAPTSWKIPVCVRWGAGKSEGRACTLLEGPTAVLPLPEARGCPEWFVPNDAASGYYHSAYTAANLAALLRGPHLSLVERLAVVRDLRALVAGGQIPVAEVLARLPDVLHDPSPLVLRAALDLAGTLREGMIPEAEAPRFARFLAKTFGPRARALGWTPKPGEDDQVRLVRPALLALVADRGGDARLAAEAGALARKWIDAPDGGVSGVSADVIDAVLEVAAQHGDRALFDRLRAEARQAKGASRRRHLLGALAHFRDPALVRESLGIVLGAEHDVREVTGLLFQDDRTAGVTLAFLEEHFDDVVKRLPADFLGRLPFVGDPFCDEAQRSKLAAFFKDRAAKLTGGPRNLRKVLERIHLCAAQRKAQEGSLAAFLKGY